ncbi:MAG: hypothetical protein JTT15_00125 [Candidatus Brockarchaeota archaeon]|nr:hypothetical protein [Candidatus Brockarchaeota archaeon]
MKFVTKIGLILISLSFANLLENLIFSTISAYYTVNMGFMQDSENWRYGIYVTYLHNRETRLLVDLKESSKIGIIAISQSQIEELLAGDEVPYFACFNFTGGLDKTLGRVDRGIYIFIFDSTNRDQVARFQLVQSGFEFDTLYIDIVLLALGLTLALLPILNHYFKEGLKWTRS